MSIFGTIKDAIWGKADPAPTKSSKTVAAPGPAAPASPDTAAAPGVTAPADGATPLAPVDVAAILDAAVAAQGQKLDWRRSIVDLMKALDLDSSLADRKELAAELGYTGDMGDSATMNVWLHKALMAKLAANGGAVPADLTD